MGDCINFNIPLPRPPPPRLGWGTIEFSRGKLYKLRISLGVELRNMEFFGGEALVLTKLFMGKLIFFRGMTQFFRGKSVFYGCLQGWMQF